MIKKEDQYINAQVYALYNKISIYEKYSINSKILYTFNQKVNNIKSVIGWLNGIIYADGKNTYYQVIINNSVKKLAWINVKDFTIKKATTAATEDSAAQQLINDLIKNDAQISKTLIRCFPIVKNQNKQLKNYNDLQQRVVKRINEVKNSKLIKAQLGIEKKYKDLLQSFGIGAVPVIGYIIGAIVLAGTGAAVSLYFAGYYDQSKRDLVRSKELEAVLKTVDPETAKKILDDLQNQLDQAYQDGKNEKGFLSDTKNILLLMGGTLLFANFQNKKNGR